MKGLPLLAGLLLAGCGGGPAPTHGQWIGDVTPRTPGPACVKTRGLAQIQDDRITFLPSGGSWILVGTAASDGRVEAEKLTTGANKQVFETRLAGHWDQARITGTYTTPRCVADVVLDRR